MVFNISDKLKELRADKNLTQNELANRLGISKSSIASYETGTRLPSLEVLIALSKEFHVTTDYLVGLNKDKILNIEGLTNSQINLLTEMIDEFKKQNDE